MMPAHEIVPQGKSWFFQGIEEVGVFAARLFKNFLRVLLISQGFNLLVTLVVYYAASGGPAWRAPFAAAIMLIGTGLVGFWISVQIAIVLSLAQTVRAKGLAKLVLDALFAELLGVTPENPEGDAEMIRGLHGMPIEEARRKLRTAGDCILENPIGQSLPGFVRWLLKKTQAVLVWATIWVVIKFATAQADAEKKIDLPTLREKLTAVVDDLVTEKITLGAIRFGLLMGAAVTLAGWGLVAALARFAP